LTHSERELNQPLNPGLQQLINRVADIEGVTVEAIPSSFIESGATMYNLPVTSKVLLTTTLEAGQNLLLLTPAQSHGDASQRASVSWSRE